MHTLLLSDRERQSQGPVPLNSHGVKGIHGVWYLSESVTSCLPGTSSPSSYKPRGHPSALSCSTKSRLICDSDLPNRKSLALFRVSITLLGVELCHQSGDKGELEHKLTSEVIRLGDQNA